ncbi:hypothetical protein HYR99_17435 [Candidatus Poribacteria bacterium]|nr:hypothetical protein [Candidatus Poribacteria bacterium]
MAATTIVLAIFFALKVHKDYTYYVSKNKGMSQPSFPHQITLKAIGFQWIIQFERTNPEGFIYGQMALQMEKEL